MNSPDKPNSRKLLKNLGPYTRMELIGKGAFSNVYKAYHQEKGLVVALKVLYNKTNEEEFLQRFTREMLLLRKLNHPHISHLHDAGVAEVEGFKQNYIALEFFHGKDLKTLVDENGGLSWQRVLKIIYQSSDALHYVHSQGILHRDLKPSNILYNEAKECVKIIDLGLGKIMGEEAQEEHLKITQHDSILGTPQFMPIEQWGGLVQVEARTDIYSLGATAYFLLTSILPYGDDDNLITVYENILKRNLLPLEKLCHPETPIALFSIIQKMMAFDITQRYASFDLILKDLKQIASFRNIDLA